MILLEVIFLCVTILHNDILFIILINDFFYFTLFPDIKRSG